MSEVGAVVSVLSREFPEESTPEPGWETGTTAIASPENIINYNIFANLDIFDFEFCRKYKMSGSGDDILDFGDETKFNFGFQGRSSTNGRGRE